MGNLNLVTGYQGSDHVTAADHGSLYAGIFGVGNYVLNRGEKLAATVVTSNRITIADGDIILQGRHIRLNVGETVSLTISSGSQGYYRNDLIVARYSRNSSTGIEQANLVVVKGTSTTGTPSDPTTYESNDLLNDNASTVDFPLYRIPISGITVGTPVQLFEVVSLALVGEDGKIASDFLPSMNYIPTSQKGAANGVATLNSSGQVPSAQLPSMDYISTSQKGAANGVASLDANGDVPIGQLPVSSSVTSSSTSTVATSAAVKMAYDKADAAASTSLGSGSWSLTGNSDAAVTVSNARYVVLPTCVIVTGSLRITPKDVFSMVTFNVSGLDVLGSNIGSALCIADAKICSVDVSSSLLSVAVCETSETFDANYPVSVAVNIICPI